MIHAAGPFAPGAVIMRNLTFLAALAALVITSSAQAGLDPKDPTWWDKYQYVQNGGALGAGGATQSITVGTNVDVSNECGPQSETSITMFNGKTLAGGSNEIFRRSEEHTSELQSLTNLVC